MFDSCEIRLHPTGAGVARVGTKSQGQGHETTWAQIIATEIGIPADNIMVDGFALGELNQARRFVVVSTQSKGDEAALRAAMSTEAEYRAFVGSRRKMMALREKLVAQGVDPVAIDRVKAPAGLDLGAITPEEIAMSILAEITALRRRGQRATHSA